MQRPPRVAAIHDLSAFGRCALSVITPIISVLGIQVIPVPTALLSTHTGGYSDIEIQNCTDFPARCGNHLKKSDLEIDAVYSGYLFDSSQAEQIKEWYRLYPDALNVVDPVLGDNGSTYKGINNDIINNMRELVSFADLVTPNPTEAALLLGEEYNQKPMSISDARDIINKLSKLTRGSIVITGINTEEYGIINLCRNSTDGVIFAAGCEYKYHSYPGTGDIFASIITGYLIKKTPLERAVSIATEFIEHCIELTADSGHNPREGVFIEYALSELLNPKSEREIIYFNMEEFDVST